jgi:UDP-2,3-diacylglucosamine hydrolase
LSETTQRYGLIAGNGRFPVLALETARSLGQEVVVIAIENEAAPEIAALAPAVHWINIGQLGKLIELLKREGVSEVMMTGQVKHVSIFSDIKPDWRLLKLLTSLKQKNTAALIGGIQRVLREEGIELVDSTRLLKPLLAPDGLLTKRKPSKDEEADLCYGRRLAKALAQADIGQSVAVSERACVAAEAMEGTDAMLRRAASLTGGRPLRLVKAASGRAHMLFDVPVAGLNTVETMIETNTTAMGLDAGRTLLLDKDEMIRRANAAGLTIVAYPEQK